MSEIHDSLENLATPEQDPFEKMTAKKIPFFQRKIVLTVDNAIALVILNIALLSLVYPYGVYHGRHLNELARQKAAAAKQEVKVAAPVAPVPVPNSASVETAPAEILSDFFTIQLGSYAKEEFARAASSQLKGIGQEKLVVKSGKYFLLCLGRFENEKQGKEVLSGLKKEKSFKPFRDAYVRPVKNEPGKVIEI